MQNEDSDILSRLSFWSVAFPDKCAVLYFISITAFSQKIITKIDKLSFGVLEYSRCGDLYHKFNDSRNSNGFVCLSSTVYVYD